MKMSLELVKKSKTLSYVLRHHPEEFGIYPDKFGFVHIDELLKSIYLKNKIKIDRYDIDNIIKMSDKKRFEICEDKIRATYGHSKVKITKKEIVPPDILYHATSHKAYERIRNSALLPMKRQYVHLSSDIKTALMVGKRKDKNPVLLKVNAREAYLDGVKFYYGNDSTYLSTVISNKYLKIIDY